MKAKALVLWVLLLCVVRTSTLAQSGINFQKAPEVTVTPASRLPIPFVPFTNQDPTTGNWWPDSTMLNLEGEKITLQAQVAQLNHWEQALNRLGYTMRGDDEDVVLNSTPDQALLEAQNQANAIQERGVAASGSAPVTRVLGGGGGTSRTKSFSYEAGSSSSLHGKVWGDLTVAGSGASLNVSGDAAASGGIMGHDWSLAQATGSAQRTGKGYQEHFKLQLGGSTIVNWTHSGITVFSLSKDYTASVKREAGFTIDLGPVPVHCTFGFGGSIGVGWSVAVNTNAVTGHVIPHAALTGYGDASIALNVIVLKVTAGVDIALVFLSYNGTLSGLADIGHDAKGYYVETDAKYVHTLNMLSGNVSFYVKLRYWAFGWHKKTWTWTLWSWKGFQSSGTIFDLYDKKYI